MYNGRDRREYLLRRFRDCLIAVPVLIHAYIRPAHKQGEKGDRYRERYDRDVTFFHITILRYCTNVQV